MNSFYRMGILLRSYFSARQVFPVCCVLVFAVSCAMAQMPPAGGQPPGQMAEPVQTPPDTVMIQLVGPESWPAPVALQVWPDTLTFGDQVAVILDFPSPVADFAADSLQTNIDWLVPENLLGTPPRGGLAGFWDRLTRRQPEFDLSTADIPPVAENQWRAVVPVRLYRAGPFQIGWSTAERPRSELGLVVGRVQQMGQTAVIRSPRAMGWYGWRLVGILLAVTLLTALACWLWRRRRPRLPGPQDRSLPIPAYLDTAVQLWQLYNEQLPARGEGKKFLDRLTSCLRSYLSDRYQISAGELTADEIRAALSGLGYRPAPPAELVRLLKTADDLRFRPQSVDAEFCRQQFVQALLLIASVRIVARFTPVPADRQLAGDLAWSKLHDGLDITRAGSSDSREVADD